MLIFRMGAMTMLLSLLPIKAADILGMRDSNHINVQLPYLQDQKSLMLR